MKLHLKKVLILLLAIQSSVAFSTNTFLYKIDRVSTEHGLPHTDVTGIAEDDNGFMWFTTLSGLCKYDGYHINSFTFENAKDIKQNRNNSILLDEIGDFLLGTDAGILKFDPHLEKYFRLKHSFTEHEKAFNSEIILYHRDSKNWIWATIQSKLYALKISNDSIVDIIDVFSPYKTDKHINIFKITEDKNNNIWVATGTGLFQISQPSENNRIYKIQQPIQNLFSETFITGVAVNNSADLVVSGFNGFYIFQLDFSESISKITNRTFTSINDYPLKKTLNYNRASNIGSLKTIIQDNHNNYWFSTESGLLMLNCENKKNREFILYESSMTNPFSLSANSINTLYITKNGSLFAGTFGGGVNIIDINQKKINWLRKSDQQEESSLSSNFIRAIVEDQHGNIYIGSHNHGLSYYDIKNSKNIPINLHTSQEAASTLKIRSLKLEKNRYLWIGTQNMILCYDVKNKILLPLPADFKNATRINLGYYSDINIDHFGNLWLTTWNNGVFHCIRSKTNPTHFTSINHYNNELGNPISLHTNRFNKILIATNKKLIYITSVNGIEQFLLNKEGEVEAVNHFVSSYTENEPKSNLIWDIIENDDGSFWIGTIGDGINKVKLKNNPDHNKTGLIEVIPITIPENIDLSQIKFLIKDHNNNLWIGAKTLYFFDCKKNQLQLYDFEESVFNNDFKVGSSTIGQSGRIYLGGTKGINFFNPDKIFADTLIPNIQFSDFLIHNKPVKVGETYENRIILKNAIGYTPKITLTYLQNNFTILFSAAQYKNPKKTIFKYKLSEFDPDWVYTNGENPRLTYANLDYKTYKLQVYASNADGIWSTTPKEITIEILPPWWKSIYAKIGYAIIILLLIWGAYFNLSNYYKIKHDLELAKIEEENQEKLHQTKLQFFTNISHEFRTPLSLILSPLEDLMNSKTTTINRTKLYKVIQRNAQKLLSLVNELIEFRSLENKAIKLETTKQEINELIQDIAEPFSKVAEKKEILYQINGLSKRKEGWFDTSVLDKIITNLLSNAFKYTESGGLISIDILDESPEKYLHKDWPKYTIDADEKHESYISFLIRDSGAGISEQSLPKIFDRFFQIDKDPSAHLGSGIGLAIVKNYVQLHKGILTVESKRDEGTAFLIKLPLTNKYKAKDKKDAGTIQNNSKSQIIETFYLDNQEYDNYAIEEFRTKKIAIVEDDKDIRDYIASKLSENYLVTAYENANNYFEKQTHESPDLIISDVMMPGINGFDFCSKIKNDRNTCHIPVILLTAKTKLEDMINGAECGADQFITKPFSMSYIFASIKNLLQSRRNLVDKYKNDSLFDYGTTSKNDNQKQMMDTILNLVKDNLENPEFSVDFVARSLGMGRTKLYQVTKDITGMTIGELIRDVKMKIAAQLLLSSDKTISDIAGKIGVSPNFFYPMFKDYYGKSPAEFQKENLN